ncbi:DEAD/DEAH box helicase [Methanoplanus limicola]|uniref:Helicase domain-containing protein n=1 Tax=Methanoplanus limicola DSM 2279 TaxID=937775 RepID=H1Z0A0_9EURY|nr:DEAD/DEAH box helicase [Methanoplanus limicola]EHQ36192.1 helicase domain-containing protein [Methanoplanus limicola DSM 2279]
MTDDKINILFQISKISRNKWAKKEDEIVTKNGIIENISNEDLNSHISELEKNGCILVNGEEITNEIPFSKIIEEILIKNSNKDFESENFNKKLSKIFDGNTETVVELLEDLGLIKLSDKKVILDSSLYKGKEKKEKRKRDELLDNLLTFIEKEDAHQIRYGIYETEIRGNALFCESIIENDPLFIKTEYGLRSLMNDGFLLPLNREGNVLDWEFRSRIAEIIRLLSKLRQRFWGQKSQDSKKLTQGVKLEVIDRKTPTRNIDLEQPVYDMLSEFKSYPSGVEQNLRTITDNFIEALKKNKYDQIADFQYRSFTHIFQKLIEQDSGYKGMILTAGTGMGKTLAYIVPILYYILLNQDKKGTKLINVYPRTKLAENQIETFIKILYHINKNNDKKITIGIDYSGTPYGWTDFGKAPESGKKTLYENNINRLWKYENTSEGGKYICPYAKCPKCDKNLFVKIRNIGQNSPLTCECGVEIDYVKYSKEDFANEPPDIYIVTTESLNSRLINTKYQNLFGTKNYCAPKLIMVDEVHLHTSLNGTQVAYLIQRLLKRISHAHETSGSPLVLGLSATIGNPIKFFSEFTGIPEHNIVHEEPKDNEMKKSGVEHLVFVKPESGEDTDVLSNLLQTCMCVLHNFSYSSGNKYKALGFVDSLDLVQRWKSTLCDADNIKKLYLLRNPPSIEGHKDIKDYFGIKPERCSDCAKQVNRNCIFYQQGECWWFMRYGNPTKKDSRYIDNLKIKSKTGKSGYVPDNYDLLITTSAMEVGYDDPNIMCVFQYQSPMNIASFTQRKGRAGRGPENRPLTVTVLSPYRTKDIFYYQNHHNLVEPLFEKPPINTDNKSIKKIHGFYGTLDIIAYKCNNEAQELANETFPSQTKKDDADKLEINDNITKYICELLNTDKNDEIIGSIKNLISNYKRKAKNDSPDYGITPIKALPNDLPNNLFSSINLPSVDIKYAGDNSELDKNIEINLGLSETSPGNVTYRWFGKKDDISAYWIPGRDNPGEDYTNANINLKKMDTRYNWLYDDPIITEIKVTNNIPKSLRKLLPNLDDNSILEIIRPKSIRVVSFIRRNEYDKNRNGGGDKDGKEDKKDEKYSKWIYSHDDSKLYKDIKEYKEDHPDENTTYGNLNTKTKGYPITFYDVTLKKGNKNPNNLVEYNKTSSNYPHFKRASELGIFKDIFSEVNFANSDTGEYINAQKIILGSTVTFSTGKGKNEEIFGYTKGSKDCALGYCMETEGVDLWFDLSNLGDELNIHNIKKRDRSFYNDLKIKIFKFEVFNEFKLANSINTFSINAFLNVYLFIYGHEENLEKLNNYIYHECNDSQISEEFREVLEENFNYNSLTEDNLFSLLNDQKFMSTVINFHKTVLSGENEELINKRLEDIYVHSMKHALKSAFVILGGFDSERDLCGWTYLNYDYNDLERDNNDLKHTYIFEHGMHGTGAFRNIYDNFSQNPHFVWNFLESQIGECPTAEEEHFLRDILQLENDDLKELSEKYQEIIKSTDSKTKDINDLISWFRQKYHFELKEENIRALSRLFSKPIEIGEEEIENHQMFRELNISLINDLKKEYGCEPTVEEIKGRCYRIVTGGDENELQNWNKFYKLLSKNLDSDYEEIKQITKEVIDNTVCLKEFLDKLTPENKKHLLKISEEERNGKIRKILKLENSEENDEIVDKIISVLFPYDHGKNTYEIEDKLSKKNKEQVLNKSSDSSEANRDKNEILKNKKIIGYLNSELTTFEHYCNIHNGENLFPEINNILIKKAFLEEVEKRLLTTCKDGCPSCLHTLCDIDGDPRRNNILLSRRLLRMVIKDSKKQNTITIEDRNIDDEYFEKIKSRLIAKLEENYLAYVVYPFNRSEDVSQLIHQLMIERIEIEEETYGIMINSGGYHKISVHEKDVYYELGFHCRRMSL